VRAILAVGAACALVSVGITDRGGGVHAVLLQSALHTLVLITTDFFPRASTLFLGAAGDTIIIDAYRLITLTGITGVKDVAVTTGVPVTIAPTVCATRGVTLATTGSTATACGASTVATRASAARIAVAPTGFTAPLLLTSHNLITAATELHPKHRHTHAQES
jgi:hypothetical protein